MQHHGSKYFAHRPPVPPPPLEIWSIGHKSTFSEHGHVAYQIKDNHEMQQHGTNILPADPTYPPTPPQTSLT